MVASACSGKIFSAAQFSKFCDIGHASIPDYPPPAEGRRCRLGLRGHPGPFARCPRVRPSRSPHNRNSCEFQIPSFGTTRISNMTDIESSPMTDKGLNNGMGDPASPASNGGNESWLSNVTGNSSEAPAAKSAEDELKSFIDTSRYVGDLISMDYNTAEVLIHDRMRQDVGGVPHGCLLLATRIRSDDANLDIDDPRTSLLLLRALKASPLPNDVEMKHLKLEAGQRAAQTEDNWDQGNLTDQFTLDQIRYAGAHCRILGTFRMHKDAEEGAWNLEFGGDIDNFYAGQGMKVYKPAGRALERIANFTVEQNAEAEPVRIGRLRYAASIRDPETPEAVPIKMAAENIIAQRTALFGMTRTGKSNTTKTIASAVFQLRLADRQQRVGQLIFDPNGEYANENPQDQGCIRNLSNLRTDLENDVVTYGLYEHPNDPARNITKFNFFGNLLDYETSAGKAEYDEALYTLYQGKEIINDILSEESSAYITKFINADIVAPSDVDNAGPRTRYKRSLFVYKSILAKAGFSPPSGNINIQNLFGKEVREAMQNYPDMKKFAVHLNEADTMTWDMAKNFCSCFSQWAKHKSFRNFDSEYKEDRNWSDELFLGLLSIFENSRGLSLIENAKQWHTLDVSTDYSEDIVRHLREGKLVILDQVLGNPEMNKQAAIRIAQRIFSSQQNAFIEPDIDKASGEIKKPPPVIIYLEEAHTLLPKGTEEDTTNIWARIAKEGAKFEIGLVYSTQEPSTIQTNILKNTENWFIAHLNNTDETKQLQKYNDFADFTDSIIKVNETGFLRVRTLSSPYTLPVQIDLFKAPTSE